MQDEIHHVFLEAASGSVFLETMERLRPWLDENEIKPVEFKHTVTSCGSVELELIFKSREEARLFERAFCEPSPV
jgi:NADH:ubiquinone oxidoreductase subunit B-like Fe-S oxidoreductase